MDTSPGAPKRTTALLFDRSEALSGPPRSFARLCQATLTSLGISDAHTTLLRPLFFAW
jgi:hypothetical protein